MTYALKTSLYFILGILGLGTAIIIGASALTFPFTSSLFLLGLLLVVTGWYRVFHIHPPHKRLGLILGLATLAAVFIIPFSAILFGLPLVLGYATILLGLLTIPPFIAIGLRGDVIRFNEARKREEIEEDVILNTPLLSVPVNPKDVVSLPKEDFEDMLKPFNVTSKNVEDYSKVPVTEISRDGDVATYRVDDPEFNKIIKDHTLPGMSVDEDFTPQIDTLDLKPDTPKQADVPSGKRLLMFFVPKNLKATELEVDQHISFIHNDEDGQSHVTGTVTHVERDTLEYFEDGVKEANPDFGKIIFELNNHPYTYVAESDDEVFRHMGQLEDVTEPTDPVWVAMLRSDYSPSFEATATKAKAETIEKMLAEAAEYTDHEDTPTKPRTTLPADPFTDILEEALTGPLPDLETGTVRPSIHIDPTDPKWEGTLAPEELDFEYTATYGEGHPDHA